MWQYNMSPGFRNKVDLLQYYSIKKQGSETACDGHLYFAGGCNGLHCAQSAGEDSKHRFPTHPAQLDQLTAQSSAFGLITCRLHET
jgi:hypothetical protein